jgi:2-dehydro-3-deoxyphosphogluconate aldolase/(4S)-4-hydroxy-2-oxoglutarate aldolase
VRFIPTGGIDESNLLAYLKFPKTLACGGSWMVKPEYIASKQFDQIRELTSRAVQTMLGLNLERVLFAGKDDASRTANDLSNLLLRPARNGNSSIQVGSQFEVLKGEAKDVVLIGTHFQDRALFFLGHRGVQPLEGGKFVLADGTEGVKLDLELAGHAVGLVQR